MHGKRKMVYKVRFTRGKKIKAKAIGSYRFTFLCVVLLAFLNEFFKPGFCCPIAIFIGNNLRLKLKINPVIRIDIFIMYLPGEQKKFKRYDTSHRAEAIGRPDPHFSQLW